MKEYADFVWDKVKTVEDIKSFLRAIHPEVQVEKDSKEYQILSHLCQDQVGTHEEQQEWLRTVRKTEF